LRQWSAAPPGKVQVPGPLLQVVPPLLELLVLVPPLLVLLVLLVLLLELLVLVPPLLVLVLPLELELLDELELLLGRWLESAPLQPVRATALARHAAAPHLATDEVRRFRFIVFVPRPRWLPRAPAVTSRRTKSFRRWPGDHVRADRRADSA
jgi:hypothetical protein